MPSLRRLLACLLLLGSWSPALAADLTIAPPAPVSRPAADTLAAISEFLLRKAVLLKIRETFDVLEPDEVERQLVADLRRLGATAPAEAELAMLDRDLLAEASYYLVSLRYLAAVGGAAWPEDRPAGLYDNDALVELEALQRQLVEAVALRQNPLPVLLAAQRLMALTEGYREVPPERDRFGDLEALVGRLLEEQGPVAST